MVGCCRFALQMDSKSKNGWRRGNVMLGVSDILDTVSAVGCWIVSADWRKNPWGG